MNKNKNRFGLLSALLMTGSMLAAPSVLGNAIQSKEANADSDWYRQAAISPDGKTIAFTYKGNLFTVPAVGGDAVPLTTHKAWDGHPVWSRDGKSIAFASERHGNLDVFVMPSTGGVAKRLTWFSGADMPTDFSPDGNHVLFSSVRQDTAQSSVGFARAGELYQVRLSGGSPEMVLTTPASEARYSADGKSIIYRGETGYEDQLRKHDTSSFARDVWRVDLASGDHQNITNAPGGDHTPTPALRGDDLYYLSDRDGVFNVYDADGAKKLTNFDTHPVRSLSISRRGELAFTQHGGLYTMRPGRKPKRVAVRVAADGPSNGVIKQNVAGRAGSVAVSPDGKEVAFIARGDVFVTSAEFPTTVRVTNTPEQESDVTFTKDGTLLYSSERGGVWQIFEAKKGEDDPFFFASTTITEAKVETGVKHAYQPIPSPDGEKIAFMADHFTLSVLERESGKVHKLSKPLETYNTAARGTSFSWSPDSEWLAYDISSNGRLFFTNIAVQKWDGSEPARDISLSGYTDTAPVWHPSGDAIMWFTARYGRRDHGSHGSDFDVVAGFLTDEGLAKFDRSKEDVTLDRELEKERKKREKEAAKKKAAEDAKKAKDDKKEAGEKKDDKKDAKKADEKEEKDLTKVDFDRLDKRQRRLTIHSSRLSDAVLSKDMSKLYYLTRFEGGNDLWVRDFREGSTKKILPLGAPGGSLSLTADGSTLVLSAAGRISLINVASGRPKSVPVRAMMDVDEAAEREYLFDHVWNQANDWFYKGEDKHGADWDAMYAAYKPKIASIGHNRDMATLVSELLGELNASHTGGRYTGSREGGGDSSSTIGAIFDWSDTSSSLKIDHIYPGGPLDVALTRAEKELSKAARLVAVDGVDLDASQNLHALMNNQAGNRVRLTFKDGDETTDLVVKPVPSFFESSWAYDRWVESRAKEVERLSGGRLGYVHVPFMGDTVYRRIYRDIFGKYFTKEALVIDTRWNRGGDLMEDLIRLLTSGKEQYTRNAPLGVPSQGEPLVRWTKPSILLMNEANYSDGHCFPTAYQNVSGGKTVGAQVPGTCSYVWWEFSFNGDLIFGVPTLGIFDPKGDWLENKHTNPDIEVLNSPEVLRDGGDDQLKVAVETLLKDLDADNQ